MLRAIKDFDIVEFAREKLASGVQPQTVAKCKSHLGAVFSIARPAWGFPLDLQAMDDAWKGTKRLGIAQKAGNATGGRHLMSSTS